MKRRRARAVTRKRRGGKKTTIRSPLLMKGSRKLY